MNSTKTTAPPALVIRHTFKAPRERVFTAFTDAAQIQRWMGPPGTDIRSTSFDARESGAYHITFASENYPEMTVRGIVTALRKPEHLAYTWRWEEDDAADEYDTFISIDFIDHGNDTEMIFTHDGFRAADSRERHNAGWIGSFAKIDGLL
jgi:uncharacterized protein YndB with AHSA1/START domain